MFILARTTPNKITAEMWKELIQAGGVPTLTFADRRASHLGEAARHVVLVPLGKDHVAEEAFRNT